MRLVGACPDRMCYKVCMYVRRVCTAFLAAAVVFALQVDSGGSSFAIPTAHAHSFVEVSVDFLAKQAQRVVVATPVDEMSTWEDAEGGRRIVTYHRLQIHSTLAGQADSEIWVRRLGGVVDKIGQRVHGTAPLRRGDTFLLFLAKRDDGTFSVLGMEQGCFPVVVQKDKRLKLGRRSFSHGPVSLKPGVRPASTLEGLSLEEVKKIVVDVRNQHAK